MKRKQSCVLGYTKKIPRKRRTQQKYDLEILKKSKSIYDIAFLRYEELSAWKHWMAVHRGKQMKKVQLCARVLWLLHLQRILSSFEYGKIGVLTAWGESCNRAPCKGHGRQSQNNSALQLGKFTGQDNRLSDDGQEWGWWPLPVPWCWK